MYKIGELSKLCKLPVKTLRFYDSEGLLIPDEIDCFTGYRYYSAARLADCNRIIALKELGFTLEEIKVQLKSDKSNETTELIDAKIAELNDVVLHTQSQLIRLKSIKEIITEGENVMFDVIIKNTDMLNIAFIRRIYKTKEEAYNEIEKIKSSLPQNILGRRSVIINYETEYRETELDLAAGVEITGKLPTDCTYKSASLLASELAVLICRKDCIEEAYRSMLRQLETISCQITGAFIEVYYEDDTVELKVPVCRLSQTADRHKDDSFSLPFVDDPEAVGKWTFLDIVPSAEQFSFGRLKYSDRDNVWLKELYFLPGGDGYWIVDGWTKGSFVTTFNYPEQTLRHNYTITQENGKMLMFIEMKDYQLEARGGQPLIYIFEKVSDKEFIKSEIRIKDNTDMPFINDEVVIGSWKARDFVREPGEFDTTRQHLPEDDLFYKKVNFKANGTASAVYGQKPPYDLTWTKGYLLNVRNEIAEVYFIKSINGKEYLFCEWKSGDYTFGGRKPYWYVFERE